MGITFTGYLEGIISGKGDATLKSKVVGVDEEGIHEFEANIQKLNAQIKQKQTGINTNIQLNWDIESKNNILTYPIKELGIEYEINKTGEVVLDYEDVIDFFPDHAVKIGDKWTSYFKGSEDNPIELTLLKKTKSHGVEALLIEFSGEITESSEIAEVTAPVQIKIKGELTYDPINKKLLQLGINLNMNYPLIVDEEDPKTKSIMGLNIEALIKKE